MPVQQALSFLLPIAIICAVNVLVVNGGSVAIPDNSEDLLAQALNRKEGRTEEREVYAGTCGDNCSWAFNQNTGVFTISGTGQIATKAYSSDYPWYKYRDSIKLLVIEYGITSIPEGAFQVSYNELESVIIPKSITSIPRAAFPYLQKTGFSDNPRFRHLYWKECFL